MIDPPADEYVSMVVARPGEVVLVDAVADVGGVGSGEVGGVLVVDSGARGAVVDGGASTDDGVVTGLGELSAGRAVSITFCSGPV